MKRNTKILFAAIVSALMMLVMVPTIASAVDDFMTEEDIIEAGEAEIIDAKDIADAEIYGITDQGVIYNVDGAQQDMSQIEVYVDGFPLTYSTDDGATGDYVVSYENNSQLGVATMIFTGVNNYTGTCTREFNVVKWDNFIDAEIDNPTVAVGGTTTVDLMVLNNSGLNVGEKSYAVSDPDVIQIVEKGSYVVPGEDVEDQAYDYVTVKGVAPGTAFIEITAAGNDTYGEMTKAYQITVSKDAIKDSNVKLKTTTFTYTGSAKTPAVVVKVGGKTLKKGTDYTVKYEKNVNAGTAKAIVKAKGAYTGSVTKTFKINKAAQKINVKVSATTLKKGATATIKQTAAKGATNRGVFTYTTSKSSVASVTRDKYHNATVTAHNAGTATITIKAGETANYKAATKTIKFTVKGTAPAPSNVLTAKNVTLSKTSFKYNGKSQYPVVTVKVGTKKLVYGEDYKYWIPGDCKSVGTKTINIWGVGKYTGSFKMTYKIVK